MKAVGSDDGMACQRVEAKAETMAATTACGMDAHLVLRPAVEKESMKGFVLAESME